jgi:hypothetical protein
MPPKTHCIENRLLRLKIILYEITIEKKLYQVDIWIN